MTKNFKKSLNGHPAVVEGHATVGRLSNNVFSTFQAIWTNFEIYMMVDRAINSFTTEAYKSIEVL